LFELLNSGEAEASIVSTVVEGLIQFAQSKEQVSIISEWLVNGEIKDKNGEHLYKLVSGNKLFIVKVAYHSNHLSQEEKSKLLELSIGADKSDIASNLRLQCDASQAENKEKVWGQLIDPKSTYSLSQKRALLAGFYSFNQLDLIRPYFDKFYEILPSLQQDHSQKYTEDFIFYLLPIFEIQNHHIVKLLTIKSEVPDSNTTFMNTLQDSIEKLIKCKKIREIAQNVKK